MGGDRLQDVFGPDDRHAVDPGEIPGRYIGRLIIDQGGEKFGTGFLIAPRVMLTAGHNLLLHRATTSLRAEFASATVRGVRWYLPDAWRQDRDPIWDIGVVELDGSSPSGFLLESASDVELSGTSYRLTGFEDSVLLEHGGNLLSWGSRLTYEWDTDNGQSGSPIWVGHGDGVFAVGVHTEGRGSGVRNRGVRLTSAHLEWIDSVT